MIHSLQFPRVGGLPTADAPGMNFGVVTEEDNGSGCLPDLHSFHPSAKKTTD